ncbi:hypothetical protein N7494_006527 [Penicillium frequentans]|uniref:Fungal-specific transcription factor domain-containing protein n=1 Tax=Penicillium frequentans TaxID=3151616 RepID=A0AAD6CXW3_9EURO|nr:hypothetical protein N7494_006527 [Penicillium glabrum]
MSYFDVSAWNLSLSGIDNQNIRLLIRQFQRTLVAVPGYGVPILQCLLPLAARHATSLDALLTLATRFRSSPLLPSGTQESEPANLGAQSSNLASDSYQHAVKNLQANLFRLQSGHGDIEEAIAISMILWISCLPGNEIWYIHLHGLIALLDSTPLPAFDTLLPLSLQKYASFAAAHADIKAITIGRADPSQRLWLRWRLCPPEEILASPSKEKMLSGWEISSGYPETLMTVIALLSAVVDDDLSGQNPYPVSEDYLEQLTFQTSHSAGLSVSPIPRRTMPMNEPGKKYIRVMETLITRWKSPSIPDSMPLETSLVLSTAWEVIRKAALIYLWRGGFDTDPMAPLSTEQGLFIDRYIREMCGGIEQIIQAAEKYHIPLALTLIWPLAVIGNEASRSPQLQDKIRDYLGRMYTYFQIPHHQLLGSVLQKLWEAAVERNFNFPAGSPLSLQSICLEGNILVPLL